MGGVVKSVGKVVGSLIGGGSEIKDRSADAIREQTRVAEQRAQAEQTRAQAQQAQSEDRRRRQQRSALTPQPSLFDVLGQGQNQSGGTLG